MIFNSLSVYSFTEQTCKPIEHGATLSASCFLFAGVAMPSGASKGQARPAGVGSGADLYVARNARSLNLRFRCVEELAVGVRGLPGFIFG